MADSLITAADDSGRVLPDLRVWALVPEGEAEPRLLLVQSDGAWARAGLRSGDRVVSWNGAAMEGMRDFRTKLRSLRVGDEVALDYRRDGALAHATVRVTPYRVHRVKLVPLSDVTDRQRAVQRATMLDRGA